MSDEAGSFGRAAVAAPSAPELLRLEASAGRDGRFAALDTLLGDLLRTALHETHPLITLANGRSEDPVQIRGLGGKQRELVRELFSLEHQQARGAWFLPDEVTLKVGLINLPSHFRRHPRYASGIAAEEWGKLAFCDSPGAVLVWSILEPLFEQLLLPFELRGRQAGVKERDEQLRAWAEVDRFLDALGFRVAQELAVMRYGAGWGRLRAPEQLSAKQRLLEALAEQADGSTARRYRAHAIQSLLRRYYDRARRGPPLRRQVVNKAFERTLAGFFGGDWLGFLDYIGEEPHPDERIATTLPETRLYVGGGARAAEIAAQQDLPVGEVERMLAAFWGGSAASPVEQRVAVLRRFWSLFDEIHARQAPEMPPLWGLVEDQPSIDFGDRPDVPYQSGLYRRLMPADLLTEIERLWGTVMLPRWPERIVSEPFPHTLMAEAFGPALKFWHGCALTAWFLCEGPYSRTDMAGLVQYHTREVAELELLGCPVEPSTFTELIAAERKLGRPTPIPANRSTPESVPGISVMIEMHAGTRRAGFERLRDVITRHRRDWTARYFDHYLRARWESELRETGRQYNRLLEESGKAPMVKRFARYAAGATNHWFGGDISALYATLGEKAPVRPEHAARMPVDRAAFVVAVFRALGGKLLERKYVAGTSREAEVQAAEQQQHSSLTRLAEESLHYLQLEEALGRPPELVEFGAGKFASAAPALSPEIDTAWTRYRNVIDAARQAVQLPALADPSNPVGASSSRQGMIVGESGPTTNIPDPINTAAPKRSWWNRLLGR